MSERCTRRSRDVKHVPNFLYVSTASLMASRSRLSWRINNRASPSSMCHASCSGLSVSLGGCEGETLGGSEHVPAPLATTATWTPARLRRGAGGESSSSLTRERLDTAAHHRAPGWPSAVGLPPLQLQQRQRLQPWSPAATPAYRQLCAAQRVRRVNKRTHLLSSQTLQPATEGRPERHCQGAWRSSHRGPDATAS